MTRDEMELKAESIIAVAKASLELQGEFGFSAELHRPVVGWSSFSMPPAAQDLMNSGDAKREIFGFFRRAVKVNRCDAVLFASDTWDGRATAEGMKHYGTGEWNRNVDRGFVKLSKMGWAKVSEAFTVTVQTEQEVLLVRQPYRRVGGEIQLLDCRRDWIAQSAFGGRQKMFGDCREENLGENPKTPAKSRDTEA